eukprot:1160353-Pelagomonas_calceolata.AAC.7
MLASSLTLIIQPLQHIPAHVHALTCHRRNGHYNAVTVSRLAQLTTNKHQRAPANEHAPDKNRLWGRTPEWQNWYR